MFNDKRIIAMIPARGGSKSIQHKNIKLFCGKPLMVWTIEAAKKSKFLDEVVVSTDDEEIKKVAVENKTKVIDRPEEFATDTAKMVGVIEHAINEIGKNFDYLVLLQPTSPFRTADTIDKAIELAIKNNCDRLLTVSENRSFFWIKEGERFKTLFKNQSRNRQERTPLYKENSCVYVIEIDSFMKNKEIVPDDSDRIYFYETDEIESIDINDEKDFQFAELMFKEMRCDGENKDR